MSIAGQTTSQKFPFEPPKVYNAFLRATELCGFEVENADEVIGRITAKSGMSALSFGETIVIRVEPTDSGSLVLLESTLKLGANLAGNHRHAKNFENLIGKASSLLKDPEHVEKKLESEKVQAEQESSSMLALFGLGILILAIVLLLKFGT